MRNAGDVYWVPKQVHPGADPKDRRHALLHACDAAEPDELGSFAYASTSNDQARHGLACVTLHPVPAPTGTLETLVFPKKTYVYPSAIISVRRDELGHYEGVLSAAELTAIRQLLPTALGLGSGTLHSNKFGGNARRWRGRKEESRRGIVAAFAQELVERINAKGTPPEERLTHGLVVSSHDVSRNPKAYQTVVPLLGGFAPGSPDDVEITAEQADWLDLLRPDLVKGGMRVIVATALVAETFYVHRSALRADVDHVPSREVMLAIESALLARLTRDTVSGGGDAPGTSAASDDATDHAGEASGATAPV